MFAAALFLAGCGGGKGSAGNAHATPGNPSNNTSVCAYTRPVGSRSRLWVQIAVTPVSLEPTACRAFNTSFRGCRLPPVGKVGTGHVFCGYRKSGSSYTITLGVFASGRRTGLAFCRSLHPGSGFKRDR